MRLLNRFCMSAAMLAAVIASPSFAQPPGGGDRGNFGDGERGGPPEGGRGGRGGPGGGFGGRGGGGPNMMRMLPVLAALDADADGKISKSEIANATAALKALDKNNDGDLTEEEMRPDFAAMGRGGPGGPGGRGRPGEEGPDGPRGGGPGGPGGGGNPEEMVGRFMQFDKNEDGKLSKDELSERMQGVITRADTNKDGVATRDELMAMAAAMGSQSRGPDGEGRGRPGGPGAEGRGQRGGSPKEIAERIFADRDADKDGKLSADEIPEQMAARLEQVDTDKDGSISRKEMEAMMTRMRGPSEGRPGGVERRGEPGGERPRRPEAE